MKKTLTEQLTPFAIPGLGMERLRYSIPNPGI